MEIHKLLSLNLAAFGEGAGSGAGTGAAGSGGGTTGETQGAVPGNTRRGKTGGFENVVFGKQPSAESGTGMATNATDSSDAGSDAQTSTITSNTREERRRAFLEMARGEYADVYQQEMQKVINARFKEAKANEEKLQKQQSLIDTLAQRYNVEDGDVGKIVQAFESDSAIWEEAAEEAGMTLEQFREYTRLQRENAALLRERAQSEGQRKVSEQLAQWQKDAETLKGKFPSFDLQTEIQNQQFTSLLRSGVPMEHAYKVLHFDAIMGDAMQSTAATTEKKVTDSIRARGMRPSENGASPQSAFTVRDDVSRLSKKERAEIARRVKERGDYITF